MEGTIVGNGGAPGGVKTALPSDLSQARTVVRYDILKHFRSRRLISMLIIEGAVLALITALLVFQDERPFNETMASYAAWASTLVAIGATLFAGDAIVSEFQSRTGFLLFPNPVKRSALFLGKFLAAALIMILVMIIYFGVAIGVSMAISTNLDHLELSFYSLGLAMLYSIAAVALAILISSFMKGSTGALILTFFLLFMILPLVDGLFVLVKDFAPTPSLTYAAGAISAILTTPYPLETEAIVSEGMTIYIHTPPVEMAVLVMAAWTVVTVVLAYFLFKRREMAA